MDQRIVVGVDGSPEATAALAWALEAADVRHTRERRDVLGEPYAYRGC